jgi:hypothetical protein
MKEKNIKQVLFRSVYYWEWEWGGWMERVKEDEYGW